MAQYYFHIAGGKLVFCDASGMDLPDDEAAWEQAALTAYRLSGRQPNCCRGERWAVHVKDGKGRHVVTLAVDAVRETEIHLNIRL